MFNLTNHLPPAIVEHTLAEILDLLRSHDGHAGPPALQAKLHRNMNLLESLIAPGALPVEVTMAPQEQQDHLTAVVQGRY